jgi:hypothetical protein
MGIMNESGKWLGSQATVRNGHSNRPCVKDVFVADASLIDGVVEPCDGNAMRKLICEMT